ncbi:MAG TPA: RNA polymerase sigma factor [Terriglobia bacterium]|nr:RNA polymerase sigma factor [Terriglobia bacterium]
MSFERELIARVQAGEEAAREELVREHAPMVFRLISRFFRYREDVEDLAQDVFLKVFRGIDQVRPDENFPGWLRVVTVNTCYDALRRIQRRSAAIDVYGRLEIEERSTPPAEPESFGRARAAVESLGPKFRIPFLLKEVEDLSVAEIADAMGITQTNVKVRLLRARRKLAALLGDDDGSRHKALAGRRTHEL